MRLLSVVAPSGCYTPATATATRGMLRGFAAARPPHQQLPLHGSTPTASYLAATPRSSCSCSFPFSLRSTFPLSSPLHQTSSSSLGAMVRRKDVAVASVAAAGLAVTARVVMSMLRRTHSGKCIIPTSSYWTTSPVGPGSRDPTGDATIPVGFRE